MMLKKIKDLRKSKAMKGKPKTEKQKEAAKIAMKKVLIKYGNPMKDELFKAKVSLKMRGRITSPHTLFKKGNRFWELRRNLITKNREAGNTGNCQEGPRRLSLYEGGIGII